MPKTASDRQKEHRSRTYRLDVNLDPEAATQLQWLREHTGVPKNHIVYSALAHYYHYRKRLAES